MKNCTTGNYVCKKELHVHDKESAAHITFYTDLTLSLGGYRFTVDQLQKSTFAKTFVVSRVGNTIIFVSHVHGFWVTFDEYGDVKVGVSSTLVTQVDGLCGYFNNNPLDDKRLPNGQQSLSTVDFGDSWFVDRTTESMCQPHACPQDLQDLAWEMCTAVKQDTFKACGKTVNIDRFIAKCLETACDCLKESSAMAEKSKSAAIFEVKKCKCSMLQNFAVECLATDENIHLDTWRSVHECQVACPAPMVHHDCYRRRCEPSCDTLKTDACPRLPGTCFSGCYCPEGMVSNKLGQCVPVSECKDCVCDGFGKSQYLTYDRQNFTFDGNCTYLLSRDLIVQDVHTFQVYTTLGPCPAAAPVIKGIKTKTTKKKNTGSCTEALHILYGEHIIHLQREKDVVKTLVDGVYAKTLPLKTDWIEISEQQNREIKIDLRKSQVEVHAAFEDLAFSIRVPSVKYGFKMEGLCGDCNGNPNDDLKLNPKVKHVKENPAFKDIINSWLSDNPALPTEDKCLTEEESQLDCLPLPPETDPCLAILDPDIFGQCNLLVDPLLYLSMCQTDMCKTGLNQLGACAHVAAYAKECSRNNLCIDWKKGLCKDDEKCPEGMIYEACGCPKTCENVKEKAVQKLISLQMKDQCPVSRIEGCMCPEGKVLHNGKCILENQCSPCDDKEHYPGDKWFPDICTSCECGSNSTVTCLKKECTSKGTVCEQGWKQLMLEEKGECCPIYKCVPEPTQPPPHQCPETLLPECGPDQSNKMQTGPDGCPKFICECKPTDECKPIETIPLEAGEKLITETTGCCPVAKIICDKSRCPAKPIKCDNPFFTVHELIPKKPEQCCPEFECKPPADKCIVEIGGAKKLLNLGETLPTTDPCIMDKCIREPDGSLTMEGLLQDCLVSSCDPGFTLIVEPNQCCGKCVQVKCVHGEKIYEPEQEWPGIDNCTTFKCSKDKQTNQLIITSMQPTCPDINACPEKFRYSDGCCKLCKPIVEDQSKFVFLYFFPFLTIFS